MARIRRHILPLTSLRFLAAILVILYHANLFETGFIGLPFFFVLSGFVLSRNYMSDSGLNGSRRAFWVARFARVYPTYLAGILIGYWVRPVATVSEWLLVLALLQAWSAEHAYVINGPAWSLSAEAFFYLLFPFLLPRRAKWLLIAYAVCAMLGISIDRFVLGGDIFRHLQSDPGFAFPLFWMPLFLLGIVLGQVRPVQNRLATNISGLLLLFLVVLIRTHSNKLLSCYIAGVISAAFIYFVADSTSRVARVLSVRWLVFLGEASYGMYLIHLPLRDWSRSWLPFPIYLAGVIALSAVMLVIVERPARIFIRTHFVAAVGLSSHDDGPVINSAPRL